MSGVEVLGALASAAQLAYYVIQANSVIIEQVKRLRNASVKFQQHADTATQLIAFARVVQSNQWLQTESMAALLQAILGRAEDVRKLLPRVQHYDKTARLSFVTSYWKAFQTLRKEERILAIFAGLEEQKSALVLCILELQTRYTGETSCNVAKLLPVVDSIQEDVSHIRRGAGDLSPTTSLDSSIATASSPSLPSTPTLDPLGGELTLVESPTTISTSSFPSRFPTPASQSLSCTYDAPLATDEATQINGDIGISAPARMQAHRYFRPSATGASFQMNGSIAGGDLGVLRMLLGKEG